MNTQPERKFSVEQVRAMVLLVIAVAEIIKESSKMPSIGGIPSGHLYAMLMEKNVDLETYQQIIEFLKDNRLVKETNNLLTWIG